MKKLNAFTMAEILLSLTIIGVVAVITLPSLTGNINERTWNTQRKALYARMSQALALMPALNGYGKYSGENTNDNVNVNEDTAAITFITEGLSKVLKINNICDSEHLTDCGITNSIITMSASTISPFPRKLSELNNKFTTTTHDSYSDGGGYDYRNPQNHIDTQVAAFETANGESIAVFYNPFCNGDLNETGKAWEYSQPRMCANFIYDLNGTKGPNTFGKDIGFITAIQPTDTIVVAPMLSRYRAGYQNHRDAGRMCTNKDDNARLPNKEEAAALFYNKIFLDIGNEYFWASDINSNGQKGAYQDFNTGTFGYYDRESPTNVRCIKR